MKHECKKHNPNLFDYKLQYMDGEKSSGMLIADKFSLKKERPTFAFGGANEESPVDGVLGIGRGKGDFVSQLKQQGIITENVIGHYLGIHGGGILFFGRDKDFGNPPGATWVPIDQKVWPEYSPGLGTLHYNKESKLSDAPTKVIFDSGTTYTYVPHGTYEQLLRAVRATTRGSHLDKVDDPDFPESQCWKRAKKPINSFDDVKNVFKSLKLKIEHRNKPATMEIPLENYLVISRNKNVCLGILKQRANMITIGDITMLNHIVIYDNEKGQLGWARGPSKYVITSRL